MADTFTTVIRDNTYPIKPGAIVKNAHGEDMIAYEVTAYRSKNSIRVHFLLPVYDHGTYEISYMPFARDYDYGDEVTLRK